ncbi:hypothetical protein HPP92_020618 [Vanilla planifolia]|uniref:Uncharacterized protein n=1 Tax=Vanilla planifolia TaxID=51239 RepID=A0A835Q7L4_VANPL|nr:hypothetical protein HPP92_020618 [Vanilla planifolia]
MMEIGDYMAGMVAFGPGKGMKWAREGASRKIKERDDIVDLRKREDDARTKSISEDRHSSKHKDDNWYQRDREDRQRFKLSHDDTHALREREDRPIAARGGRPIEEKALSGNGRRKEDLKGAVLDKDYHHKDRRRHNEQSKREKPRKVNLLAKIQNYLARESTKTIALTALRYAFRKETFVLDSCDFKLNRRGSVEQESNNRSAAGGKVVHGDAEQFEDPPLSAAKHREEDHASCDESQESRRGRSKLEREIDIPQGEAIEADKAETTKADGTETIADALQVADKFVEERDRHLDTVAKLRMRSERFKLPMPGEKDKDIVSNKKSENEPLTVFHGEAAFHIAASEKDIKIERPARKGSGLVANKQLVVRAFSLDLVYYEAMPLCYFPSFHLANGHLCNAQKINLQNSYSFMKWRLPENGKRLLLPWDCKALLDEGPFVYMKSHRIRAARKMGSKARPARADTRLPASVFRASMVSFICPSLPENAAERVEAAEKKTQALN